MSEKDFDQDTVRRAGPASMGDAKTAGSEDAPLGRIDQYELLRELGGGGFGSVFLARDTVAGVDVAVKGLPPMVRNNAEELERIRENFALVSKLHHPSIAAALHLHPAKEVSYTDEPTRQKLRVLQGDTLMVMAYASGVTLAKWRRQFPEGRVPVPQALEVCSQVAEALDYAHREKVVHRDVKPSNIMVETRGESSKVGEADELIVKVLDFGLAAEIRSSMSRVSQEKGDTSGTRPYMAPEQWTGKKQDGRTDQYALAVLFYELVSGAVPFASVFDTGDPVIMSNVVKSESPEPLAALTKTQNAALLRALSKEPAQRFPDCVALVASLSGQGTEFKVRGSGGNKASLWLVGVAVVVAVIGYGTYRTYEAYTARRAAAEQAVAIDTARREKVAGLKASAETALAAGDLKMADEKIIALAALDVRLAGEIRKQLEDVAGEREARDAFVNAKVERDSLLQRNLDAGQGFGELLREMNVAWAEAELARGERKWAKAVSDCGKVNEQCKGLAEQDISRQGAKTRRDEAEKAKREAETVDAVKDAVELFGKGGQASSRAAAAFEKGEFAESTKAWQEATQTYASSKTRALAVQDYRKSKESFEEALARDRVLIDKYGGAKWAEVKRQQEAGEASLADPAEGSRVYGLALAALPGAVTEAESAEREEKQRLAAEKKAREEKERQDKITTAIGEARAAKALCEWQRCADRADEALALEAGNAEATALKAEAEKNLAPTLTVVVEAGGRQVAADISDGRNTYTAPHTFALTKGQSYTFTVSIRSIPSTSSTPPTRYKPSTLALTADWKGPKTQQMTLEENKPSDGEAWASPGTGMEFVWIPALKIWVGKYEVTNGEYRKKESVHASGRSKNGDSQPVVYVNFDDAKAYAAWLTERDKAQLGGLRYRLPSETEWQVFAQCGDSRMYPWGNAMPPKYGNYCGQETKKLVGFGSMIDGFTDGYAVSSPVALSGKNDWGLYGVGGNVWEVCATDAFGSSFGGWRGGAWMDNNPDILRCAYRFCTGGSYRLSYFGFRLVVSR